MVNAGFHESIANAICDRASITVDVNTCKCLTVPLCDRFGSKYESTLNDTDIAIIDMLNASAIVDGHKVVIPQIVDLYQHGYFRWSKVNTFIENFRKQLFHTLTEQRVPPEDANRDLDNLYFFVSVLPKIVKDKDVGDVVIEYEINDTITIDGYGCIDKYLATHINVSAHNYCARNAVKFIDDKESIDIDTYPRKKARKLPDISRKRKFNEMTED